jgi:hypothetical protein
LRGAGFWAWKPEIIRMTMETLKMGDILHYSDSGVKMNPDKIKILFQGLENTDLVFSYTHFPEAHYTKGDLFELMEMHKWANTF